MDSEAAFEFDANKNLKLKSTRGVGFEEIIFLIHDDHLLDVVEHPNKARYPRQRIFVIDVEGYIFLVPFERTGSKIFLKTIYPSRKATRDYLKTREK